MKYEIGKIISQEYQRRRELNFRKYRENIDHVFSLHPELKQIDQSIIRETASTALEIAKDGKPRQDSEEKSELLRRRMEYLSLNDIPVEFDSPLYTCPTCKDTGYISANGNQKCQCYNQLLIPLLLKDSNFKNITKYRFSQFELSLFSDIADPGRYQSPDSPRKQMEGIRNAAKHFLDNFNDEATKSLFFRGSPGTGKTFLSGCIANILLMRGNTVLYLSSPELFEKITEFRMLSNAFSPDPERFDEASRIYQNILECDLLILDDLGTETVNANRQPELLNIMNHRIDSNRKTIISTNLDTSSFSTVYDERVLSRIFGNFSVLKFFGEDLRHFKKQNHG